MREFKHKITGIKGVLLEDGHLHFDRTGGNESCHETIWFGFIENSKDWEEIKQPYWELLSYTYDGDDLVTKRENGKYLLERLPIMDTQQGATFKGVLTFWDSSKHAIHSIKRLNDGVIFTVGQTVICNEKYVEKIESIDFYQEDHLIFNFENTSDNFTTDSEWDRMSPKIEALLTTADGVELFKGDVCYVPQQIGENNWSRVLEFKATDVTNPDDLIYVFAKKENAEKFINNNKKKYSLNDVERAIKSYKVCEQQRNEFNILKYLKNEQPSK